MHVYARENERAEVDAPLTCYIHKMAAAAAVGVEGSPRAAIRRLSLSLSLSLLSAALCKVDFKFRCGPTHARMCVLPVAKGISPRVHIFCA